MKREWIGQMLEGIDSQYIAEAVGGDREAESCRRRPAAKIRKIAAAALAGVVILGTGVSVGAATSSVFRDWVRKNFLGQEITKIDLVQQEKDLLGQQEGEDVAADMPLDRNEHLSMAENIEIYGERESFVCQYHRKGDEEIIDQVYSIQDNGLKKLQAQDFHGKYDGVDFSFEYVIINKEIFAFNADEEIVEVFHYVEGDNVYAAFDRVEGDTIEKGCIARLNLKTGTVTELTNDHTLGNMVMSPNGKVILINYRAEGYWSAFDLASCTEKKIDEIDGYAHMDEVVFKGDYQVLTWGDTYMDGDVEMTGTKLVDLRTGKRLASYKECGDYGPEWIYEQKKGRLEIRNVEGSVSISIETDQEYEGYPHSLSFGGDYVLLGNLEDPNAPYYLCNLKERTYKKIDAFPDMGKEIEIYLAAKEGKILLTDGKEAYLVTME